MQVATWILAIATSVLAISGPVALAVWIGARRADRERRERERQDEFRDRILKTARDEFVPKTWVGTATVLAVIGGILGGLAWSDRKDGKRPD